jgi:acyl transferase domain-containing protein
VEPKATSTIGEASRSQPACTAIQIGLVRLLEEWGFKASAVVGHSSGEMAAAYTAGLLTAPQAIIAAYYRGAVVSKLTIKGAMLAAGIGAEEAHILVAETSKRSPVVVACINSPQSVTISGDAEGIEEVLTKLSDDRKFARKLNTNGRAYHSHQMKTVGNEYQGMLEAAMKMYPPLARQPESTVRWVSSVTGADVDGFPGAAYWRKNLESPVLFQHAVEALITENKYHLIELGPHGALELPIKQIRDGAGVAAKDAPYTSALNRNKSTVENILGLAGSLYLRGYTPDFENINKFEFKGTKALGTTLHSLSPYKWNYDTLLWNEPRSSIEFRNRKFPRHELLGSQIPGGDGLKFRWRNMLKAADIPWVEDHKAFLSGILFPRKYANIFAARIINCIPWRRVSSYSYGGFIPSYQLLQTCLYFRKCRHCGRTGAPREFAGRDIHQPAAAPYLSSVPFHALV